MRPGDGPLGKVFFPESERTGPPDGGRPHSTVPGAPGAGACEAVGGGEMTTVASEAAIGLPLSGEIGSHRTVGRNSSRRLRLPSAVTVRLAGPVATERATWTTHTATGRADSDSESDIRQQPSESAAPDEERTNCKWTTNGR